MEIQEAFNDSNYIIRAYEADKIIVNEEGFSQSFIITRTQLLHPWPVAHVDELHLDLLHCLVELKPQLVLLGTGRHFRLLSSKNLAPLLERGIAVECMDTRAACRTYTALSAEGRSVAAALILEKPR